MSGMENQIRYIDLGNVSNEMYISIWEYDQIIDLNEPFIIKWSTEKTLVSFWQGPYWSQDKQEWENYHTDLSGYFNSKELSDIEMVRYYQRVETNYDAEMCYYVESPYVTNFIYFYPDGEDQDKRRQVVEMCFDSIEETLEKTKVDKFKREGNDLFFKKDEKWKKFVGTIYRPASKNWGNSDFTITYEFDFETANRVRSFDNKVKMKKFHVDDIQDMVGGLWEVDVNIKRDETDYQVVSRFADKLGMTLRNDTLTQEEKSILFERGHKRLTNEQWYLYGDNGEFDKKL